jgi:hypothetical protein
MLGLVVVLWCVYVSDCFVRQQQGRWTLRAGVWKRMHAAAEPDVQILGERFAFAWTPLLPWLAAYSFSGGDVSLKAARRRLDTLGQHVRWLNVAAGSLFVWLMVVLPLLVLTDRFLSVLLVWTIVAVIAWASTLVLFFTAWKRTHHRSPPSEVWLTMTLSPVSLMRAPSVVTFSAASDVHPVAAAAVLCDDGEFLRVARLWYFDDVDCRAKVEEIAKDRGLLDRLSAGPEAWESGVSQFCPRCHGTYTPAATGCSDCEDVALRPLAMPPAQRT